jgi:hypothetical protein
MGFDLEQLPGAVHFGPAHHRDFPYGVDIRVVGKHITAEARDCPGQVTAGEVVFDLPGDGGGVQAVAVGAKHAEQDPGHRMSAVARLTATPCRSRRIQQATSIAV